MKKKTPQEIEIQRQQDNMLKKGATYNEIHDGNKRAEHNRTGKTEHQRLEEKKRRGGSGK